MYFDDSTDVMVQSEDARYLKRKVKGGNIDVHPHEKAIVVNYEIEATILGELGEPMLGERKLSQKVIHLKSLGENTNISALAKMVVEECKLIHISKLPEIEQLLYYLQNRKVATKTSSSLNSSSLKKQFHGLQDPAPDFLNDSSSIGNEIASISNIDDYVEMLYEDIPAKVKGSALLLRLTRNPDNLEELHQHETVLGALTRVLREDWKKSVELSTNIMYIFFCFSSYTQFHSVISKHKIGALCMTITEFELKRHDSWKEDLLKKKMSLNQNESLSKDYEKLYRKFVGLAKKQEQLLRVAFYLLLNLAEDTRVEVKMKNKGIVNLLVKTLETRRNPDLILLVISFLKKLSIFSENKNEMLKHGVIPKLLPFLVCDNDELKILALRLLLNLSFDFNLRQKIVENGMLPKIADMLEDKYNQTVVLCLLYHLSFDKKIRSLFSYTECIPQLLELVFSTPPGTINIEVAALCINLATQKKNTEIMCDWEGGKALKYLVKRAFKFKDVLIFKMLRNMSQHSGPTRDKFIEFAGLYAKAVKTEHDEDLVIECLGTLANLQHPDIDYGIIFSKYDLMSFIQQLLVPGNAEDDLVLECVVLLGTIAFDSNCAAMLADSGIIQILIELLNAKQEDDELVLQIAYVFHQMVWHEETRNVIILKTQVPAYLIDLMHDRNSEIRRICDNTLDIVMEFNSDWAKRIKLEKFRWHNSQWVEMIENQHEIADDDDLYDDDVLGPYLHGGDLLYEPHFEDDLIMENIALEPELIDGDALQHGLVPSHIIPSGYLTEYADPSTDPRFMIEQGIIPNGNLYESQFLARPSSPNFVEFH